MVAPLILYGHHPPIDRDEDPRYPPRDEPLAIHETRNYQPAQGPDDRQLEAAHRARRIGEALRAAGAAASGILESYFTCEVSGPPLGRLTTVALRTSSAIKAHRVLGRSRGHLALWLARLGQRGHDQVAARAALGEIRREAMALVFDACAAYEIARRCI